MSTKNYGLVKTNEHLDKFVRKLVNDELPFGFDIESGYSGEYRDKKATLTHHPEWFLVGFSFTNSVDWARYAAIAHDGGGNLDTVPAARALWKLLATGLAVIHNVSFEFQGVARWFRENLSDDPEVGEAVRESNGFFAYLSDSMIEGGMIQEFPAPPVGTGVGLKAMTKKVFGHEQPSLESLFNFEGKRPKKDIRFNVLPLTNEVVAYACEDAVWCLALHFQHYDAVKDNFMFKTETKLARVLAEMELEGLELDWAAYEEAQVKVGAFLEEMNEEIQNEFSQRVGEIINVNIGSPLQMQKLLYDKLGLPVVEQTKTGAPSTGESALRSLAKRDPVIKRVLEWREVAKLKGSYIEKYLKELRYASDGRAHPNHMQLGAATGRMSVSHVSYQQWPKKYEYQLDSGKRFELIYRNFLISPPGYRIVGFDYANVELRFLAGLSQETAMIAAFNSGADFHKQTAATMFKKKIEDVTDKERSAGKTISFATVYGSGAQNIADLLGISKEEAQKFLAQYFAAFPNLRTWMDKKVLEGREQGYVETYFGRKFKVWEFLSGDNWIQSKGERMCVNAPVQGGAADYMKIGMLRAHAAIRKAERDGVIPVGGIKLVMTIHDALEFYVRDDVATQTVIDLINPAVSYPLPGFPEIRADWHEGWKWGTVAEVDLDENRQVAGYSMKVETSSKETFKFKADDIGDLIAEYDQWKSTYDEELAKTDAEKKNSPAVIEEMAAGEASEEEPEWLHQRKPVAATITLSEMPLDDHYAKFREVTYETPGSDTITLVTPEGTVTLNHTTFFGDTLEDAQELIQWLLPGAVIRFGDQDAKVDDLAAELAL